VKCLKYKLIIGALSLQSSLTGIGRYTYEIANLLKNDTILDTSYYYGYYSKKLIDPNFINSKPYTIKSLVLKNQKIKKIIRKLINFSSKILSPQFDLYWEPNFIPLDGVKAKKLITTVHDFSFMLYKEFHPKERIEYYEKFFFKNVIKSDFIITGSNYSKQEIIEKLDFSEDKIRVIYHGINHDVFKVHENNEVDFELPSEFILCVGSIEPRKNLKGLLKAYSLLDENLKNKYKLVLVGFSGWENKEIMTLINENKNSIFYLGFLSDEELAKVYNRASCFVFPSFYEGFGLPPLEAMACGTPVVASRASSIPEVCLDTVEYFNPNDIDEISEKISLVLNDKDLQSKMIERGLKRASEFSWQKSADEHLKLFKEVLGI